MSVRRGDLSRETPTFLAGLIKVTSTVGRELRRGKKWLRLTWQKYSVTFATTIELFLSYVTHRAYYGSFNSPPYTEFIVECLLT